MVASAEVALPVAAAPTQGNGFALLNVRLPAGAGVSFGMHPSPAPITLRADASMPLTVCHDLNPEQGGTALPATNGETRRARLSFSAP